MIQLAPLLLLVAAQPVPAEDTVWNSGEGTPVIERPSIPTIWKSPQLGNPTTMAKLGSRLVIGDGDRVHIIERTTPHGPTIGRRGEGPGEFSRITAVGTMGDTIVVLDTGNRRFSLLDSTGASFATFPLRLARFINPTRLRMTLRIYHGRVLFTAGEQIHTNSPQRKALAAQPLKPRSDAEVIDDWTDVQWKDFGSFMGPGTALGSQ